MTEAEITEQIVMMMDLTLSGLSLFFTIVSAYTVALFYFLRRAPFGLKLMGFLLFTFTMLLLLVVALNAFAHAAALQEGLVALGPDKLSTVGDRAVSLGRAGRDVADQIIRAMTLIGMTLVYFALAYFTFFHRWTDAPARDAAPQNGNTAHGT